jgi:hypothetical protein
MKALLPLIRHALTVGAGFLIAKGTVDEGTANEAVGALMTLIAVVWSYVEKHFVNAQIPK